MNITDAIVLSRKKSTKFLGEVFAYQSNEMVDVEGILSGGLGLSQYAVGHTAEEDITVNGQSFGTGVIKSVSVSAKNQAGLDKRVKVTFEVFKTGSTTSLGSEYPSIPASNFKYIKSFSENSSCDINQEVKSYSHSVNVKLTIYNGTGVSTAQSIASTFLNSNNLVSSSGVASSYNTIPGKTFFDESYDEINSECNFSRKYDIATNDDSTSSYILFRSNSLSYDAQGVATVTENAEYQDIAGSGAPIVQANTDIDSAYGRCGAILANLTRAPSNVGQISLIDMPLTKGMTVDNDARKVTYHITYSTNIKIDKNNKVYHEYTNTIETTNAGITYTTLEGTIVGMGEVDSANDRSKKYVNALSYWRQVISGGVSGSTLSGNPHSVSTNHNQIKGTIGYSIKYSNCPSIQSGARKIRRIVSKLQDQQPNRKMAQTFRIINNDELLQLAHGSNQLGNRYSSNTVVNGDHTVAMKDLIDSVINVSTASYDNFGVSASFSFNSTSRQLTANIEAMALPS